MTSAEPMIEAPASPAADPAIQLLERIAASLDTLNRALAEPPAPRLLLRLDEVEVATGLDKRTIQRERSAGRFPEPSVQLGRAPLWTPESLRAWIEAGGRVSSGPTPRARRA